MRFISRLSKVEKKYALSFFGFLIAVILGGITIYIEFYRDNSPEIKTEIIANASILDIKEDITDLQIIYHEENIKKSHKNLTSLIIKLSNTGRNPILNAYYDDSFPFGLQISDCEIIKNDIVSASNTYLINKLKDKKIENDKFIFPKIIFEPDDYIVLKFLLMHSENQKIKVTHIGKVASTKFLNITETFQENDKELFWQQIFSGSIIVHLSRIPIYFIIFIFLILIFLLPPFWITTLFQEKNRYKTVTAYKKLSKLQLNEDHEKIFNYYISKGLHWLKKASNLLTKKEELLELMTKYQKIERNGKFKEHLESLHESQEPGFYRVEDPLWIIRTLITIGVINVSGEKFEIESQIKLILDDFVEFVKIKNS
jgi:hypothetical protein